MEIYERMIRKAVTHAAGFSTRFLSSMKLNEIPLTGRGEETVFAYKFKRKRYLREI